MPEVSSDLNMVRITNDKFVKKAEACIPKLHKTIVKPVSIVDIIKTDNVYPQVNKIDTVENLSKYHLSKGNRLFLDFGNHQVGYVTLQLNSVGSPQDAPAFFRLKFGEIAKEMTEDSADYDGWISRGWIQEEFIHVDVLPAELKLPRRYAFRYMEIEAIDTSLKWQLVVEDVTCVSVSAVSMDEVKPVESEDEMVRRLDQVSLRTLMNCMQSVFEDGPKRDRRLWLGDLRLQALANYHTFKNFDLVKRCLYLFAAQTREDGLVSACLFTEPKFIVDDTFLLDYSMFFGATLLDYYKASGDMETLRDLSKCAYRQMEIVKEKFDEKNLLVSGEGFWAFIDWTEGLDKQAAMQGVYIFCAKKVQEIAEILGDEEKAAELSLEAKAKTEAAKKYLMDTEIGLFISGPDRQINYASQVWLILAGSVSAEDGAQILDKVKELNPEKGMISPYMNHHYVEALLMCGKKEQAMDYMKYYWGGMINSGADTFWELYNPENPAESPYGSSIVNSYCHAWSCTPTYLLRKYYIKEDRGSYTQSEPIFIRPHHGMCLAYFKGAGYSDEFSVHMQEMLDVFRKGAKVQLHADTDEICSACPNNEKGRCSSFSLVERYDNAVLEMCGLENGQIMDFDAFTGIVQKEILASGKRREICGNCQWNSICENQKSRWEKC